MNQFCATNEYIHWKKFSWTMLSAPLLRFPTCQISSNDPKIEQDIFLVQIFPLIRQQGSRDFRLMMRKISHEK